MWRRSRCGWLVGFAFLIVPVGPLSLLGADRSFTIESPETRVALVELFTSEGCSSCPPAEAWLGSLRDHSGLWKRFVPVAFHVDYWNHLGWTDRFAMPEFTRRQRVYAERWQASTIYTPALVLNGEEWSRTGRGLPSAASEAPGRLRISGGDGGALEVSFIASREWHEPLIVEIVPLAGGQRTEVPRGENAGRELRHDFVALALVSGELRRAAGGVYVAQLLLPDSMAAPVSAMAAWVRSKNSPVPIQAAGGWVP